MIQERCADAPPSRAPSSNTDMVDKIAPRCPTTAAATHSPAAAVEAETAKEGDGQGQGQRQRHQQDYGQRFGADVGYVDVDTRVSRESYGAARMAAGAVLLAVSRRVTEVEVGWFGDATINLLGSTGV